MEKVIAFSICFIILSFASCTGGISYHDNVIMSEMVKAGADPIGARCGVKGGGSNVCAIYTSQNRSSLPNPN